MGEIEIDEKILLKNIRITNTHTEKGCENTKTQTLKRG